MADRREAFWAGAAAAVAFAAVVAVFALPYVTPYNISYPLGWDSPFYVWRTSAIGFDGLARIGGIRPATPLLL
ncbi:MAG: hypothetical protein LC722_07095, partial [Actinobacteria bacterium]|nr:hypothetical protein [Actinomycetota bacterium]